MSIISSLISNINKRVEEFGALYTTFGVFGIINYPASYIYHAYFSVQHQQESIIFRIMATILCLTLAVNKHWPYKLKIWLPIYWHFCILICLPTFGTYSLLLNNFSNGWLMNDALGLFLLILLADWLSFIILLVFGIILGVSLFVLINGNSFQGFGNEYTLMALYMYSFAILLGGIFSRNKARIQYEKLLAMKTVGGTIAHEMRTPFLGIRAANSGIKDYLPLLLDSYQKCLKNKLIDKYVDKIHLDSLQTSTDNIEYLVNRSLVTINVLLASIKGAEDNLSIISLNSKECVMKALQCYPLTEEERDLIRIISFDELIISANETLLMHILFNLLNNAIYHIKEAGKGIITISTEVDDYANKIIFKDSATGIEKKHLRKIFNKFYTTSDHRTGIGLSFCKEAMISMGGKITCQSKLHEYTIFTLIFPKK